MKEKLSLRENKMSQTERYPPSLIVALCYLAEVEPGAG